MFYFQPLGKREYIPIRIIQQPYSNKYSHINTVFSRGYERKDVLKIMVI